LAGTRHEFAGAGNGASAARFANNRISSTQTEFSALDEHLWGRIRRTQTPLHDPGSPGACFCAPENLFRERNTPMPTGTVKFFSADKGYGFIAPEDGGADSFVHITAVQAAGMHSLEKDQRVTYDVEVGKNGKASAVNLSNA
jgi:cold shock protein